MSRGHDPLVCRWCDDRVTPVEGDVVHCECGVTTAWVSDGQVEVEAPVLTEDEWDALTGGVVWDTWLPGEGGAADRPVCPGTECGVCGRADVMTDVIVPAHLSASGKDEQKRVPVDACIAPLVWHLNRVGFLTAGCCCGHGRGPASIVFHDGTEIVAGSSVRFRVFRSSDWTDGSGHVEFDSLARLLTWVQEQSCDVIVSVTPSGEWSLEIYDDYRE